MGKRGLLNRKDIPHFGFQYDTTFNFADVYVFVLFVRFEKMESVPVIPLMFMMHESKINETHNFFSQSCVALFGTGDSQKHLHFH